MKAMDWLAEKRRASVHGKRTGMALGSAHDGAFLAGHARAMKIKKPCVLRRWPAVVNDAAFR